jgi:hypothetical protein
MYNRRKIQNQSESMSLESRSLSLLGPGGRESLRRLTKAISGAHNDFKDSGGQLDSPSLIRPAAALPESAEKSV